MERAAALSLSLTTASTSSTETHIKGGESEE